MVIVNIATNENESIIQINKNRIKRIKSFSREYVSNKLAEIKSLANIMDFKSVQNILENELFFERIEFVKVEQLIEQLRGNKDMLKKLLDSYMAKGFKGFDFSWMPIILPAF